MPKVTPKITLSSYSFFFPSIYPLTQAASSPLPHPILKMFLHACAVLGSVLDTRPWPSLQWGCLTSAGLVPSPAPGRSHGALARNNPGPRCGPCTPRWRHPRGPVDGVPQGSDLTSLKEQGKSPARTLLPRASISSSGNVHHRGASCKPQQPTMVVPRSRL